jgi:hypothetical protein
MWMLRTPRVTEVIVHAKEKVHFEGLLNGHGKAPNELKNIVI